MSSDYDTYKLISDGNGEIIMAHHIMKITKPNFNIKQLMKPLKMFRDEEKPKEEEQSSYKRKKKNKLQFLSSKEQDVVLGGKELVPGALIASQGSKLADPDRVPWILSDAEHREFIGRVEGAQRANYVLFVHSDSGMRVVPVQKWYKFTQKTKHRILTLEEAEEKMNKRSSAVTSDRWMMSNPEKEIKRKKEPAIPTWKQKILGIGEEQERKPKPKKDDFEIDEFGFDYKEEWADDEEVNLEINPTHMEEAEKRMHKNAMAGEAMWDYDSDDGKDDEETQKLAQKLSKRGVEHADYGPENPYWSDGDEAEQPVVQKSQNSALEKVRKKKPTPAVNGPSMERNDSDELGPPAKRAKIDSSAPPPPKAEEVLKRMKKEAKRRDGRGQSASPVPVASDSQQSGSDGQCLSDDIFLEILNSAGGNITVRELILKLTDRGFQVKKEEFQARMKFLMKQYATLERSSMTLYLKSE